MRLVSTTSPLLLGLARRSIRSDQPTFARVPDTRYISELNFYHQHAWMRCWLFRTVGHPLRCDDARDAFWGCGPRGSGGNGLGRLYMAYRDDRTPDAYRVLLQRFTFPGKRNEYL